MKIKIKRALFSVSNKEGLEPLLKILNDQEVELVASGGTARQIEKLGYKVTPVEEISGNPEAFGGRVKTLSFQIAGAILHRRESRDQERAKELGIKPIDLVVCNLYPFEAAAKSGASWDQLVEQIDIGGPTLIRSAAKNFEAVAVLTDPKQYLEFSQNFKDGSTDISFRKQLAKEAFSYTAHYEQVVAAKWQEQTDDSSSPIFNGKKTIPLRYGENPHQRGWFASDDGAGWKLLQGKELSYNNYLDADAAYAACVDLHFLKSDFQHSIVVVKHTNPCGAALGRNQLETLKAAWAGDPISAFGGILAFNEEVDGECASWLAQKFVEVIIAPAFSSKAREIFSSKPNLRLIEQKMMQQRGLDVRSIVGGFLLQDKDDIATETIENVTKAKIKNQAINFGIVVCKHLKSNSIALVTTSEHGNSLIGAGMGNPNRLVSTEQAIAKARENNHQDLENCLLVSDAFFPFKDNVELAYQAGIRNIIQPGGSVRDREVIDTCDRLGVAMGFTKVRHFRH